MKIKTWLYTVLLLIATCGSLQAQSIHYPEIHCRHFIYGIPVGTPATNDLIIREIYAMSTNDSTKFADWVAYRLDPDTVAGNGKTSRKWKADPDLDDSETLEPDDYDDANKILHTDRGHQAPLAAFKGTPYWYQTNYLSNITPQRSDLNQGAWKYLEDTVRHFVEQGHTVYVLTGPLYEKAMPQMPGADEPHTIPSGYWKIIIHQPDPSTIRVAAFLFPQDTPRRAKIADYQVTVDEVEQRSGLDVLWELPDDMENTIEGEKGISWLPY